MSRFFSIERPSRWALPRVLVLGTLGGWLLPMPWQGVDVDQVEEEISHPVRLGPAALAYLERGGR